MSIALTIVLAVGIGIALGLFGGGGSILAVPLLVYVAGLPAKQAIAMSLLVVGATSAAGLIAHARAGRVRWRTGLLFAAPGLAGAYGGGRLAAIIPAPVLLTGFAIMMLATAVAMLRGRHAVSRPAPHDMPAGRVIPYGVAVGLVAGLVGAGGGFLVVPALALLGGLAMPAAVGTSLLVISGQSLAGFAGHLSTTTVHWGLAAAVTAAAVGGGLLGVRLVGHVHPDRLRRAFGWLVAAMAALVLSQQLPPSVRTDALLWTATALAIVTAFLAIARPWRRRSQSAASRPRTASSITIAGGLRDTPQAGGHDHPPHRADREALPLAHPSWTSSNNHTMCDTLGGIRARSSAMNERNRMCRRATCRTCKKATYRGCGMHVDQVLAGVPRSQQCACTPEDRPARSLWSLIRRR